MQGVSNHDPARNEANAIDGPRQSVPRTFNTSQPVIAGLHALTYRILLV
jgi:hypothetical protein